MQEGKVMAKIEFEVTDEEKKLFENYCKRTGKEPAVAADNGITNCINSEAIDALTRLISKGIIPAEIVAESGKAVE